MTELQTPREKKQIAPQEKRKKGGDADLSRLLLTVTLPTVFSEYPSRNLFCFKNRVQVFYSRFDRDAFDMLLHFKNRREMLHQNISISRKSPKRLSHNDY